MSGVNSAPTASDLPDYTCPMHPEVRQKGPGTCPKCGMALEPVQASADEAPDPEDLDVRRRLIFSAVLTIPLFLMAMADFGPGRLIPAAVSASAPIWAQLLLAAPVVLWGGLPFFVAPGSRFASVL
jgi:cation transport ATPase